MKLERIIETIKESKVDVKYHQSNTIMELDGIVSEFKKDTMNTIKIEGMYLSIQPEDDNNGYYYADIRDEDDNVLADAYINDNDYNKIKTILGE